MMAFLFPDAPEIDDEANGYTWDGEKWTLPNLAVTFTFHELFDVEHPDQLMVLRL